MLYLLYKIGQSLALLLPRKVAYRIAGALAALHCSISKKDRESVLLNLRTLGVDEKQIHRCTREVFRNFAKYLVDFFRFPKIDADYISKYVKLENKAYLDEALAKGKGVVAISAHLGNWELGGAILAVLGYPVAVAALIHKDERINQLFVSQRTMKGVEVISVGRGSLRRCFAGLSKNRVLGLLGDRNFSHQGLTIDFLRKPTPIPRGPAVMSLRTGAPIMPGFLVRERDDSFRFIFEKPIEFEATGNESEDVENLTKEYLKVLEKYIRAFPTQWYIFRPFWEVITEEVI